VFTQGAIWTSTRSISGGSTGKAGPRIIPELERPDGAKLGHDSSTNNLIRAIGRAGAQGDQMANKEQLQKMKTHPGFIAADRAVVAARRVACLRNQENAGQRGRDVRDRAPDAHAHH